MTLGLSKLNDSKIISVDSSEAKKKKRKFDELMSERQFTTNCGQKHHLSVNNERHHNDSLESPPKRSRYLLQENDSNRNSANSSTFSVKANKFFANIQSIFRRPKPSQYVSNQSADTLSPFSNTSTSRTCVELTERTNPNHIINSDKTSIDSPNKSNVLKSQVNYQMSTINDKNDSFDDCLSYKNSTLVMNTSRALSESISPQASNLDVKPKLKRKDKFQLRFNKDKEKYRMLINSHLSNQNTPTTTKSYLNMNRKQTLINLTLFDAKRQTPLRKDEPYVGFNSSNNSLTPAVKSEILDNTAKVSLIDRIRNSGINSNCVKSVQDIKNIGTPLNGQYFPAFLFTPKLPQTNVKTSFEIVKPPESSDKFKDLIKNKNKLLDENFTKDMRNSLFQVTQSYDKKESECINKYNQFRNKRQEDNEKLCGHIKSPIVRSELVPYFPFYPLENVEEEEEEEDEMEDEEEEEEDEKAISDLPILTQEMERMIDEALRPTPPNQVLAFLEAFSITITRKDMETLSGLNWLNDEIINYYMSLIVERSKNDNFSSAYAFNTFFYPKLREGGHKVLKRWTRKVDIFAFDYIFVPIHLGVHWCLAVINFTHKKIEYYDSMGGNNNECLQALRAYIQEESVDKKKSEYDMSDWTLLNVKNIPQQLNGSDCGMFTCKYAEYISRNSKLNFSQINMPYFRRRMVYEILTKRLL